MDTPSLETPEEAEHAFYVAFQAADLAAMMQVWADDDAVACIHPLGPRLQGRAAVEQGWREMFQAGTPLRFEVVQSQRTHGQLLAVHCVRELIYFGPQLRRRTEILATNVYRKTPDGWRMLLHHGSPVEASEVSGADQGTLH